MLGLMNRLGTSPRAQKFWLALECGALFIGAPAAGATALLPAPVIPLLLLVALGCGLALRLRYKISLRDLLRTHVPAREWRRILVIYLVAVPCLVGLLWFIKPAALFSLLLQHTGIWLLVMFAYPILSVFPQELIYRAFFFKRYQPLFGQGRGMILASAALFSFGHVLFHNWPAILLSFAGGCLFGRTYQRTSSLLPACIEHSLYGCAAFTIGYGAFFFDSTVSFH
jgi:membrane protease YdiL (CAAX protease family)